MVTEIAMLFVFKSIVHICVLALSEPPVVFDKLLNIPPQNSPFPLLEGPVYSLGIVLATPFWYLSLHLFFFSSFSFKYKTVCITGAQSFLSTAHHHSSGLISIYLLFSLMTKILTTFCPKFGIPKTIFLIFLSCGPNLAGFPLLDSTCHPQPIFNHQVWTLLNLLTYTITIFQAT